MTLAKIKAHRRNDFIMIGILGVTAFALMTLLAGCATGPSPSRTCKEPVAAIRSGHGNLGYVEVHHA